MRRPPRRNIALARMLDGQVSAVIGTHTHVQTADEQIFPGGTAFLVRCRFYRPARKRFGAARSRPSSSVLLPHMPQRFDVAQDRVLLQGALIDLDDITGKAIRIARVSESAEHLRCHGSICPGRSKSQWDFGELFAAEPTRKAWSVSGIDVYGPSSAGKGFCSDLGFRGNHKSQGAKFRAHLLHAQRRAAPLACVLFRGEPRRTGRSCRMAAKSTLRRRADCL